MTNSVEIKKSALHAETQYDFDLLMRDNALLVPLQIESKENAYAFSYDTKGLENLADIKNMDILDIYKVLLNALQLYSVYQEMNIHLQPENLYIDSTLKLRVAYRDVYTREDIIDESVFVKEILSLLGALLQKKYTYSDFINSGVELLQKNKLTSAYTNVKTLQEIQELLLKQYQNEKTDRETTKSIVKRSTYKRTRWGFRIAMLLVILLGAGCGYLYIYENLHYQAVNEGYEAYIAADYIKTIDTLENVSPSRMDVTTKYILSVAYIKTDGLTEDQREKILSNVTISSNEKVLDFWVNLAQADYDKSIDLAKQLDSKEYLAYGYMKKKDAVEKDASLSGEERESSISEIDSELTKIKEEQDELEKQGE
ncbi:MAG: type VII secretion protein EssB/YukC [Coprobacillaceae bacterium]